MIKIFFQFWLNLESTQWLIHLVPTCRLNLCFFFPFWFLDSFGFGFVFVCLFILCFLTPEKYYSKVSLYFPPTFWVKRNHLQFHEKTFLVLNCQSEGSAICVHFVQEPSTRHQNPVVRGTLHKNPPFVKRRGLDFICPSRSDHCACFRSSKHVPGGLVHQNDFLLVRNFFWLRELVKPTSCFEGKVVLLDERANVAAFVDFQDLAMKNVWSELSEPLQRYNWSV